ncbi:hypothetical protein KRM28CT15_52940 [Krasilnikovia sp. M28-CT-15]
MTVSATPAFWPWATPTTNPGEHPDARLGFDPAEVGVRHADRPAHFNRSWDARCAKAGIRKITVHDARRTCGSLLADLDVHPRVAMTILRHARFSITMRFTQVSSKSTREALKKLGESLDR